MKNYILPFLLGVAVTISIAATTNSLMVFKPAKPKNTKVYLSSSSTGIQKFITDNIKEGYQVDQLGINDNEAKTIVIMVKY